MISNIPSRSHASAFYGHAAKNRRQLLLAVIFAVQKALGVNVHCLHVFHHAEHIVYGFTAAAAWSPCIAMLLMIAFCIPGITTVLRLVHTSCCPPVIAEPLGLYVHDVRMTCALPCLGSKPTLSSWREIAMEAIICDSVSSARMTPYCVSAWISMLGLRTCMHAKRTRYMH